MISTLRHLVVDSWLGRIIAFLIFLAFVGWGVGDMVGGVSGNQANTAVTIGSRKITAQELGTAIQNELPQIAKRMGVADPSQIPMTIRQQVAQGVLQRFLAQNEVLALAARNGMRVPDSLVRKDVFAMDFFHGTDGTFDRAIMTRKLSQIGMTERDLLSKVRDDIAARNLLDNLGDTMQVPAAILNRLLTYNTQEHVVDLLRLDNARMAATATPEDVQLRRFYDTHPWLYRSTEYRHAKIVLLSADTIARSLSIPDADLRRIYDFELKKYEVPETRDIEVLTLKDRVSAQAIAAAWRVQSDWAAIQKRDRSAASVAFPKARQSDIPSPELAKQAFAAPLSHVQGPIQTETGWIVFRVTAIMPPHKTDFDHAKGEIRDEMAQIQAPQILGARIARFQDVIAGSNDLDQIPSDLGALPAQGSLDSQGLTKDGEVAPLPGDEESRKAIIARIFSQKKGEKPTLVNGPKGSVFAVLVDEIEPSHVNPYDSVREQVGHDWMKTQRAHHADERATALMRAARQKGGLAKVVVGTPDADLLQKEIAVSRTASGGLSRDLLTAVLAMKPGETGMFASDDSVTVFTVTGLRTPSAESTKAMRDSMETQLRETMQADVPTAFVRGLEGELKPKPNLSVLRQAMKVGTGAE